MKKNNHNKGFTLAEVLIVVALIGVLSGVAFISVASYLRSMIQLERDGIAKEIFVAAQNHLTMVEHEGYLNQSSYGHLEGTTENQDSIYYFVVNNGIDSSASEVLKLMLPFGSVDETVRLGGSYVIRYQKNPGLILDVFYCTENGRFPHAFDAGEYDTVKGLAGEGQKAARRNCSDLENSVIGWYGGVVARTLGTVAKLEAPAIEVINEDELYVKITNPNESGKIKLIIQGERSHAQGAVFLEMKDEEWIKTDPEDSSTVIVILDDITKYRTDSTTKNNKFSNLGVRLGGNKQGEFIPGENISIQAVAYNNDAFTNIAYSALKTTNSLYKDVVKIDGENTAYITSLRHLENLDASISALSESLKISAATQKTDLSWKSFLKNIEELNSESDPAIEYICDESPASTVVSTSSTEVNTFKPVNLTSGMAYDGESHTISDVVINIKEAQKNINHAGLIEKLDNGTIRNLMLKDFSVSTIIGDAGTLAGALTGEKTNIENVVARNTPTTDSGEDEGATSGDPVPSGVSTSDTSDNNGNAGGLVGSMAGGTMTYCASAICVEGKTTAGGLIGATVGGSVSLSYSGGHTKDGSYKKWIGNEEDNPYDVTGITAGGLIGKTDGTNIDACYSTCSVSGTTAGGFVGQSSGSKEIKNSYATGLVKGTTIGAFAGKIENGVSLTNNTYYEIINEIEKTSGGEGTEGSSNGGYLPPIGSGSGTIEAFDKNANTYDSFVGKSSTKAKPYDSKLTVYYGETYFLKGIAVSSGEDDKFVATHYGDWPAPEIFVINTGTDSGNSGNGSGGAGG